MFYKIPKYKNSFAKKNKNNTREKKTKLIFNISIIIRLIPNIIQKENDELVATEVFEQM